MADVWPLSPLFWQYLFSPFLYHIRCYVFFLQFTASGEQLNDIGFPQVVPFFLLEAVYPFVSGGVGVLFSFFVQPFPVFLVVFFSVSPVIRFQFPVSIAVLLCPLPPVLLKPFFVFVPLVIRWFF